MTVEAPVALVVNAASRSGHLVFDRAEARLKELGVPLATTAAVEDPGELPDVVAAAVAAGARTVVLGGGDGTVSGVVKAVSDAGAVLGLLPTGTANDLARTLQVPSDLDAACDVVANGRTVDVDLGLVGDDAFVNVASVGLAVGVTKALTPELKSRLGALAYPVAAVRAYGRHHPFSARLEFPEGDHEPVDLDDLLQVAVANGRFYGGGNVAAPDAGIDDHLLDVYAIPRGTALHRLRVARHFVSGAFTAHDEVLHVRTRAVRLVTEPSLAVNVDGEVGARTPLDFGIRHNGLLVRVPADADSAQWDGTWRES